MGVSNTGGGVSNRHLTELGNQLGTATVTMLIGTTLAAQGAHTEAVQSFKAALAVRPSPLTPQPSTLNPNP